MLKLQRTESGDTNMLGRSDKIRTYVQIARKYSGQKCLWLGQEWIIRSPHVFVSEKGAIIWQDHVKKTIKNEREDLLVKWKEDLYLRGLPPQFVPVTPQELSRRRKLLRERLTKWRGGGRGTVKGAKNSNEPSQMSLSPSEQQRLRKAENTIKERRGMSPARLKDIIS